MKVTFKLPDGRVFTEEYDTAEEFIADQLADYDVIPDDYEVIQLEISAHPVDFTGNIGELYDFLTKK